MTEFGYAGKILTIDLSRGKTGSLPTIDYVDRFLGGRGIAAKLYWDLVPPRTGALDPDNCLICVTGPVAGFTGLAGCRRVANTHRNLAVAGMREITRHGPGSVFLRQPGRPVGFLA